MTILLTHNLSRYHEDPTSQTTATPYILTNTIYIGASVTNSSEIGNS